MIISASRRTDIPAFYADWFMQRIREGFFQRINPFNRRQVSRISLKREDVDAICFWSKYPRPLMAHLDELDRLGLTYYFQFTLNAYDSLLEPNLPSLADRLATFRELAGRIGKERVVWRYDPVILTSRTPAEWHLEQMEMIAGCLAVATERLVFSFHDCYGTGKGRLQRTLQQSGVVLVDPLAPEQGEELKRIATGFRRVADQYALKLVTCSEQVDLSEYGISHGACIDGALIHTLSGGKLVTGKDKYQRQACRCVPAADMGIYNSCRFRCAYCYANFNPAMIERICSSHDQASPSLLC